MERFKATEKTALKRLPKRGAFERETIEAILDEGLIAHAGFVEGGQPFVLPMIYGRDRDVLYLHGAAGGRHLRALAGGRPICVTVTIADGLVLARSAFHHSMNYRCVVVLGRAKKIEDEAEKLRALELISEHVLPRRWQEARKPNKAEMKQTLVVSLPLLECSAKVRTGPPLDEEDDYSLPIWAGVVPMTTAFGAPLADGRLAAGVRVPKSLEEKISPARAGA